MANMAASRADRPDLRRTAVLVLVAMCLLWGLGFPVSRALMLALGERLPTASPWMVASVGVGLRFLVAMVVLGLWRGRRLAGFRPREAEQAGILGVSVGFAVILQVMGLATIDASASAFLTQLYAVIVPVWVALRLRRWPGLATTGAVIFALVGASVLAGVRVGSFHLGLGETLTIASAFLISIQVLWLGRARYAKNDPFRMSFLMYGVVAVIGLAAAAFPGGSAVFGAYVLNPVVLTLTVGMGIFSTVITFTMMNIWQPVITPVEAGMLYTSEPIFAAAAAFFLPAGLSAWTGVPYPNEAPSWNLVYGGICVLAANFLVQIDTRRPLDE